MADETSKKAFSAATQVHPRYNYLENDWVFWLRSYMGGQEYIDEHLFRFYKESDNEFTDRKKRAYRYNNCRSIIERLTAYLYKEPPTRKHDGSGMLEKFYKNVDGRGTTIDQFMKLVASFSTAMGLIYVVMDKRELPEEERTGTQADNLKNLPYCYMVMPNDMRDVGFDDYGRVKWAVVRERVRKGEDSPYEADLVMSYQYRVWVGGDWTLYDDGGEQVDSGTTDLPFCPIITVKNEASVDPYAGSTIMADVAPIDRAIMNNWSNLDTIVCDQTFSQLIFPIEGFALPELATDKELRDKFMVLATKRVLLYSAASPNGAKPEYIAPDAAQAAFILEMIGKQVYQLYTHIGLEAGTGDETKPTSGVSKAYDFEKLAAMLAGKAANLEEAEERIVAMFGKWVGAEQKCEVKYPRDFDIRALADEILMAIDLQTLNISETFMKEVEKRVVRKALPKAVIETIEAIDKEIDEKEYPDPAELAAQGLEGTSLTKPAERKRRAETVKKNAAQKDNSAHRSAGASKVSSGNNK